MHASIDADIVCFRVAAASENDPEEVALQRCNDLMYRILQAVDAQTYTAWLSGGDNVRKGIDPSYKANRKGKIDPRYRETVKAHLITEWSAKLTDGIEADDALAIEQSSLPPLTSTICSIDKDLLQIPGLHYNFVREEYATVSDVDGLRSFYRGLITGDVADNIFGCRGLGPVKSARLINHLESEEDMLEAVQSVYSDNQRLLKNGVLMWLMREPEGWWTKEVDRKGWQIDTQWLRTQVAGSGIIL